MIDLDWGMLAAGAALGAAAAAVFFGGLAWGMALALRRAHPAPVLMLSAALRIALLLALGWGVGTQGGALALVGFTLAFMVARFVILSRARFRDTRPRDTRPRDTPRDTQGETPWS